MIKMIIKLIWKRRKKNFMTTLGITLSFIVLFLANTFLSGALVNYFKPIGYEYENVSYIAPDWKDSSINDIHDNMNKIDNYLRNLDEIENFSYSRSYIFVPSAYSGRGYQYEDNYKECRNYFAGNDFAELMGVNLVAGRWFDDGDRAMIGKEPVIINKKAREILFEDKSPIGEYLKVGDETVQVVGEIDYFRNGSRFANDNPIVFRWTYFTPEKSNMIDPESMSFRILFKLKPGVSIAFEQEIAKEISRLTPNWTIRVRSLEEIKGSAEIQSLSLPLISGTISVFLLLNVALGLFGIFWYQTSKRTPEIGLRRALGSSAGEIYKMVNLESMVVATSGLLLGSFFTVQFWVLKVFPGVETISYILAFVSSIILIYLITFICTFYPARKATRIDPSLALHDE